MALLERLGHRYELRNPDKARMTSLSWAAAESRMKAFEWLLIDHAHDDQELSRVNSVSNEALDLSNEMKLMIRTTRTTLSFIFSLHYPAPLRRSPGIQSYPRSVNTALPRRFKLSLSGWQNTT